MINCDYIFEDNTVLKKDACNTIIDELISVLHKNKLSYHQATMVLEETKKELLNRVII